MARSRYTDTFRAEVVAHAADHGVTAAAEHHGVSKGSVSKWCKAAGVETVHPERTAKAVAAHSLKAEERRARLADRLLEIAELGTERTVEIINTAKPRDLVGLWTRAVHDHLLLTGGATHRVERIDHLDAEIERLAREVAHQ